PLATAFDTWVSSLVTVTLAPGIAARELSKIEPVIVAELICATNFSLLSCKTVRNATANHNTARAPAECIYPPKRFYWFSSICRLSSCDYSMMTEFQRGAMLPESHDFFRSARAPRVLGPEPRGRDFGPSH